jgi:hypothetical protein
MSKIEWFFWLLLGFVLGLAVLYIFHLVVMALRHCGSLT